MFGFVCKSSWFVFRAMYLTSRRGNGCPYLTARSKNGRKNESDIGERKFILCTSTCGNQRRNGPWLFVSVWIWLWFNRLSVQFEVISGWQGILTAQQLTFSGRVWFWFPGLGGCGEVDGGIHDICQSRQLELRDWLTRSLLGSEGPSRALCWSALNVQFYI